MIYAITSIFIVLACLILRDELGEMKRRHQHRLSEKLFKGKKK